MGLMVNPIKQRIGFLRFWNSNVLDFYNYRCSNVFYRWAVSYIFSILVWLCKFLSKKTRGRLIYFVTNGVANVSSFGSNSISFRFLLFNYSRYMMGKYTKKKRRRRRQRKYYKGAKQYKGNKNKQHRRGVKKRRFVSAVKRFGGIVRKKRRGQNYDVDKKHFRPRLGWARGLKLLHRMNRMILGRSVRWFRKLYRKMRTWEHWLGLRRKLRSVVQRLIKLFAKRIKILACVSVNTLFLSIFRSLFRKLLVKYCLRCGFNYLRIRLSSYTPFSLVSAQMLAIWAVLKLSKKFRVGLVIKRILWGCKYIKNILGCKVSLSGRFNRRQVSTYRWRRGGSVLPLSTIGADVDFATAKWIGRFGLCGIKVWVVHRKN